MTDTVNVPREWLEEIAGYLGATDQNDWSGLRPDDAMRGSYCLRVGALMELRAMLAAAPKTEPVSGSIAEMVSELVNETAPDQGGTPSRAFALALSLQAALASQPEAPKVEQDGWFGSGWYDLGGKRHTRPYLITGDQLDESQISEGPFNLYRHPAPKLEQEPVRGYGASDSVARYYERLKGKRSSGHPAPASDELLEALKPFADAAEDLDDGETGHIWERPAAMSIDASDLRRAYELYAKHKGPQS